MRKKTKCFLFFLCCCSFCTSQQVISSGGNAVKSDVFVNWILGGSLTDIPIYDLSALNKLRKEQLIMSEVPFKVYPNPAVDFIKIEIAPVDTGRFIFELYNNSGIKVLNKPVLYQPVMQLDVSNIPSGTYLLKVYQSSLKDQLFRVEKIIKY